MTPFICSHASYDDCSSGGLISYSDSESQPEHGVHAIEPYAGDAKKKKVLVLGTGWAGISFLKNMDISSFDVQVVSPRNYFAFTPLLPSVTCGTVEARSIVEPVRNIIKKVMTILDRRNTYKMYFFEFYFIFTHYKLVNF